MGGTGNDKALQVSGEADGDGNEELEIVLEGEEGSKEAPAEPEKKAVDGRVEPEEGIEELRAQLEAERRARADAERRAITAVKKSEESDVTLVKTAIETVKRDMEALKSSYRDAIASQNHDAAAEINLALTTHAVHLRELESGFHRMRQEAQQPDRRLSDDLVENFASRLSPRSAEWVRKNPQFVTDQRLHQKMIAAHNLAMADGHKADSDEYFAAVEETLKMRQPTRVEREEEPMAQAATVTQRRQSAPPPAAPVSKSSLSASGSQPRIVRLSAAEREHAEAMGMKPQEYAENKARLIKEGRLQ